MSDMHNFPRAMPRGSSAFADVMADFHPPPEVNVIAPMEESDGGGKNSSSGHHHDENNKVVHGLNHCYKIENGKIVADFQCQHDHSRLSNGHINEIAQGACNLGMPNSPRRRASLCAANMDFDHSRTRSASPRRGSLQPTDSRPGSARRGSADMGRLSPSGSPGSKSPNTQRRGSLVAANSGEMQCIYDQYLKGKKK